MRVLFLADTHLGFDDPLRSNVERHGFHLPESSGLPYNGSFTF